MINIRENQLPFKKNIDGVMVEIGEKNNEGIYPLSFTYKNYTLKTGPFHFEDIPRLVTRYVNQLVGVKNNEKLHISQMEFGEEYKVVAFGRSSEYSIVRKHDEKVEVTYMEGDFNEQSHTVHFSIDTIHLVEGFESLTLEDLTVDVLEEVSISIYELYMSNSVPEHLKGKINVTW